MVYERSPFAGDTDYTGVPMRDILLHLKDWRRNTDATIEKIKRGIQKVNDQSRLFENPEEVVSFGEHFIDLFSRYGHDIDRLIAELPQGVTRAQVEIVEQIYKSSRREERLTVEFKQDLLHKHLAHEEARQILGDIYASIRGRLVDFRDFSNLVPRLRTFISESPISDEVLPEIELKPGIFGISINLNRVLPRIMKWWRKRKWLRR